MMQMGIHPHNLIPVRTCLDAPGHVGIPKGFSQH